MKYLKKYKAIYLFLLYAITCPALSQNSSIHYEKIDLSKIEKNKISILGNVILTYKVRDIKGDHLLILTKEVGDSQLSKSYKKNARIDLRVYYYHIYHNTYNQEWTIKDYVDCPELDSSASFFTNNIYITDLNADGVAEVTVPYKMFCGGGVDPETVKVIMRQEKEKFAIRGESLIVIKGIKPYGGEYKIDQSLSIQKNKDYKNFLEKIYKQVYIVQYK